MRRDRLHGLRYGRGCGSSRHDPLWHFAPKLFTSRVPERLEPFPIGGAFGEATFVVLLSCGRLTFAPLPFTLLLVKIDQPAGAGVEGERTGSPGLE